MGKGKGNPEGWVARIKPGRILFPEIDENVNTFRNVLYPDNYENNRSGITSGWSSTSDQYEDPLQLGFEISFDTDSPFFGGDESGGPYNSMGRFMSKYSNINEAQRKRPEVRDGERCYLP